MCWYKQLPQKKAPGEYRLIHHLSYPRGSSVNEGIPVSVHYASFDSAVAMVARCGRGALLGKCDIKSAFRRMPIHPTNFDRLGFQFGGSIFIDMAPHLKSLARSWNGLSIREQA